MNIKILEDKFSSINNSILKELGKRDILNKQIKDVNNKIKEIDFLEGIYSESINVFQQIGNIMKTNTIERIETLITKGLSDILEEDNLKFVIQYEAKRNVIGAKYQIYDKITESYYDIINSFGGGLVDIVSILQRVIFLYQFNIAKILILDEAGKWISNDKQGKFGNFLNTISNKLGIQIILISHREQVIDEADQVIRIVKKKGYSEAEVVRYSYGNANL